MKQKTLLFSWLLAMLFSIVGASPAWAQEYTQLYEAQFTNVATHSYTQNKTFTLNSKSWTASVSQVNGGVFYLGCNSTNSSKGVLNNNTTFSSVVTALCNADATYNSNKTTAHAYAMLFENAYSEVTKVRFEWVGGNNAFQVYLFGDSGSGYVLLSSTNYSTSGQSVSGNVEWTGSATNYTKFAIVARPGATNSTATNKTLRAGTFYIYKNTSVPITSITGMESSASVGVGGTVTLTPTVLPANTTETVVWESDDTDVATVSGGVVTGVAAGSTTIRAKSPSDATIKAECTVSVTAAIPVTGVTLDKTSAALEVGGTVTLTPTIAPADATNKNVTWESADEDIATVEDGVVTAIAVGGPVNITVKSVADPTKTATCAVTVNPTAVTGVTLNKNAATIKVGKTETLTATVSPSNATNKAVTWSSNNTAVATVSNGVVTTVAAGNATITVTTTDGGNTATCAVTVITAGDGSLDKPYDVEEALEIIDGYSTGGESATNVYVRGKISTVSSYSSNTITYYISDDGTTTNQMQVYKGKNVGNTNFSAKGDLTVGDEVVIYGKLKDYNSTPEINTGNYIYLLNGQKYNVITFAASPVAGGEVEVKDAEDDAVSSGDEYYGGSVFNIQATANTGYSFSSWTSDKGVFGNAANAMTTFTLPDAEDAAITANFTLNTHDLVVGGDHGSFTTTVNGEAWDGSSAIAYGSTVSITAVADKDYAFSVWSTGNLDSYSTTTNPLVFTMPDNDVLIEATFIDANIEYDVNISQNTGGTISRDKAKAKAGETVTLSYILNENYVFDAWTVLDGSANEVTVTDNKFTMPASDVEVEASFIRQYTVTYNVAGVANNVKRNTGATLSLDDPSAIDGMAFAGWSSANSASAPVFVANTTTVTADMTLYAVFVAKAGVNVYQLVEEDQDDWRGDYLIAYNNDIFADGRKGGTSTNCLGAASQKASTTGRVISVDKKTIDATWGDTYHVSLVASATSGYYLLRTQDGKYNYQSSNANGLVATDTKETADSYKLTITFTSSSDVKLKLTGNANGAVFRYNTGGYFRYYKDGGQSAVYLYKKVSTPAVYTLGEKVSMTVTSAGYATYCSDKALDFSHTEGLKAYIVTSDGSTTGYTQVTDVPANTGLLLKASADNYDAYIVGSSSTDVSTNKLVGVTTATGIYATTEGKTNFVLKNGAQGVGFYKVKAYNDGNPDFTVKANSAYLSVALSLGARENSFFGLPGEEGETTGIHSVENGQLTNENGNWYTLGGQKMNGKPATKGIYIINGKKVVVK